MGGNSLFRKKYYELLSIEENMTLHRYIARLLVFSTVVFLFGCASQPQTYWVNPRLSQTEQQHRYTLDSTECTALANQYVPEPQSQTTNITLNTPQGPVYGTASTGSDADLVQLGLVGGMMIAERQAQRRTARSNYAGACMAQRGWQQRAVGNK